MADRREASDFCPIPFLQLQLNPLGNVSACCFSGQHSVGNVKENTIAEIWNGPRIKEWRKEFLEGNIKICADPMRNFGCHKNYQHLRAAAVLSEEQPAMPRRLDLRLNGQCNLECVMCDVWRHPNHLYDESDFWTLGPEKIFPHLLEVDMLGGEPFIQKDTFRFINAVLEVNQKCTWGFITNGQYRFTPLLASYLDRLELRHIHVSVDSLEPTAYARIRKKGNLQKTLDTVEQFVAYRAGREPAGRGFAIFASLCLQKDNWSEIPAFLEFCDERRLQPIIQLLIDSDHLSFSLLSREELSRMQRELEPFLVGPHRGVVEPVLAEIARFQREARV